MLPKNPTSLLCYFDVRRLNFLKLDDYEDHPFYNSKMNALLFKRFFVVFVKLITKAKVLSTISKLLRKCFLLEA